MNRICQSSRAEDNTPRATPRGVHSPPSIPIPSPIADLGDSENEATSVKLYFVRHATAARKSTWHQDDDLRPLTRTGRARFRTAAQHLIALNQLRADRIITSPLVRARQTADILDKILVNKTPVIEDVRLGHGFTVDHLRAIIAQKPRPKALVIIGHNPSFCEVLSSITGETDLDLRKGACALVEISDFKTPHGRLMWLAPPTLF